MHKAKGSGEKKAVDAKGFWHWDPNSPTQNDSQVAGIPSLHHLDACRYIYIHLYMYKCIYTYGLIHNEQWWMINVLFLRCCWNALECQDALQPCSKITNQRILWLKPLLCCIFTFQGRSIIRQKHGPFSGERFTERTEVWLQEMTDAPPSLHTPGLNLQAANGFQGAQLRETKNV